MYGDFHPGNVILTKREPVAIDWMTAIAGSKWADVSRTNLLLSIAIKGAGKQVKPIIRLLVVLFYWAYNNRCTSLSADHQQEMDRWMPVTAAARLNEEIAPERGALIRMVEEA